MTGYGLDDMTGYGLDDMTGYGLQVTAATVSTELYLDMHHCGLWVTRNVAITPINYSTFDAFLHWLK